MRTPSACTLSSSNEASYRQIGWEDNPPIRFVKFGRNGGVRRNFSFCGVQPLGHLSRQVAIAVSRQLSAVGPATTQPAGCLFTVWNQRKRLRQRAMQCF